MNDVPQEHQPSDGPGHGPGNAERPRPPQPPEGRGLGAGPGDGPAEGTEGTEVAEGPEATTYALPLVVRLERTEPPARTDAMETAARAVLTLLADERAADGGEWGAPVRLWEKRGIRKVVRRARGAEWRRAEALPGITVTGRTARLRVFPPVPVDGWPRDLARLQVSGTELADPEPPGPPGAGVPVMWLNPGLEMSAGKAMAQAAHGAQLAWWELDAGARQRWRAAGFPLAVRVAEGPGAWDALQDSGLPVVRDAGFTEVAPGSCTVVADHPALARHL